MVSIMFYKIIILTFFAVAHAKSNTKKLNDEVALKLELHAERANLVSSLLKNSAERAAANAPIIINRDSELFKQYEQQRLPRRAPNPEEEALESIFREDTKKTTPKPHPLDGRVEYKPSTTPPSIETNEVEAYTNPNKLVFSQDEPVESLEDQLFLTENSHYEALRLPEHHHMHTVSKLPPIDSDLYDDPHPHDHAANGLNHLNLDSYAIAGHFVRPKPNYHHSSKKVPAVTPTTPAYDDVKDIFDGVFGYQASVPKPTFSTKAHFFPTTTTEPYQNYKVSKDQISSLSVVEPVASYKPQPEVSYHPETTTRRPILEVDQPHQVTTTYQEAPVIYRENIQHYKDPFEQHYEVSSGRPESTSYRAPEPDKVVTYQISHVEPPRAQEHHYEPHISHEEPPRAQEHHYEPQIYHQVEPPRAQEHHQHQAQSVYTSYADIPHDDLHGSPGIQIETYESPNYFHKGPEPAVVYKSQPHSNKQIGATTPHPLVFGFKPVASFVSSTIEDIFGPKKQKDHARPTYGPPPPPPQHQRQPKYFYRQTYQHSKPVRFPLGRFFQ